MFDGYLSYGGIELINAERTTAYVNNLMPAFGLFRRTNIYDNIHIALEQTPYRSPFLDDAEWVETDGADDPAPQNPSHRFYGLYPLEIQGIGDSTMSAAVTEGIRDGGSVNSERDASRPIRVRGLLVGADQLAVESGLTWLRNALRTNSCGMHGDGCGYNDARYFLAAPDVCDPRWNPVAALEDYQFADFQGLDAASSPLIFTPEGDESRPLSYAQWSWSQYDDGATLEMGLMDFDSSAILEQVTTYTSRTNFVLNPSFTPDTVTWSAVRGVTPGQLDHVVGGGRAFARVGGDLGTTRVNYLPDPSFENGVPTLFGWRSETPGGVTAVTDGTAPNGTKVARVAGVAGQTELEVTVLGPADMAMAHIGFSVKQNVDDLVMTLTDNAGVQLEQHTFTGLASAWNTLDYAFAVPVKVGYVIAFTTAGTQELRMDSFMLVDEGASLTFFDGDSGANYGFRGGPSGISYYMNRAYATETLLNGTMTTHDGAVALGLDLRSIGAPATVTIKIVTPEGTVVATSSVTPGQTWSRYFLGSNFGRAVHLEIDTTNLLDVDNVMIETGAIPGPYFDGDFPDTATDEVHWENPDPHGNPNFNTPSRSVSVMRPINLAFFQHPSGNARPFINVLTGSLSVVELTYAQGMLIPLEAQLEPFDRTYHRVSCTTGVKKIRDYVLQVGAAIEVDFILTAATPHAFSTQSETIEFDDDDSELFSDTIVNLVPYPSFGVSVSTSVLRTNLCPNPSAEAGVTGWTFIAGTTGVGGLTSAAPSTTTAFGTKVLKATWSTASTAAGGGVQSDFIPVTVGAPYSLRANHVKASIVTRLQIIIDWYTAGAAFISSTTGTQNVTVAGAIDSTNYAIVNATAPATATQMKVKIITVAGTSYANWSIGSYLEVDGVIVTYGQLVATYFDGSTVTDGTFTHAWTGTVSASTSTEIAPIAAGAYVESNDAVGAPGAQGTCIGWRSSVAPVPFGSYYAQYLWVIAPTGDLARSFGQDTTASKRSAVTAGQPYVGSISVNPSKGQRMYASIYWMDAAGAQVVSATTSPETVMTPNVWTRLTATGVAPVGAVYASVLTWSTASGAGYSRWAAGDGVKVDGAMIIFGTALLGYFDGSTTDTDAYTYSWDGGTGSSTSRRSFTVVTSNPLIDPDLPVVPTAPKPPTIPDVAITAQNEWLRYFITIPSGNVAEWASTVPTLTLSTKTDSAPQVRVRFHPNPFDLAPEQIDPSNYCGEFLLSYLPANSALTVSGVTQEASATVAGGSPVPANQLLYGTDGTPMDWPELSCAISYVMTVDIPPTADIDNLNLDLIVNRRE